MKKLHSQRGASMVMALLLLLIATTVSVVILTAASTATRHTVSDRLEQQAYLTVSSAAELFRDEVMKTQYVTTIEKWVKHASFLLPSSEYVLESNTPATGSFGALINEGFDYIESHSSAYHTSFTMTAKANGVVLEPVTVDVVMQADHSITAVFTLDRDPEHNCRLFLKLRATTTTKGPDTVTREVEKGTGWQKTKVTYDVTTTTTTTTWGDPQLGKGDVPWSG